jgi:uncharacterized DUF497 family protein
MKFRWDNKKNSELIKKGRPSFEDAVNALAYSTLLMEDVNPVHPGQRIYVIEINGYPHVIPYEVRGDICWLITGFPARKYKR